MEFKKCKLCGGYLLRLDPLSYDCAICGKKYTLEEVRDYVDKTPYIDSIAGDVEQCFYNLDADGASAVINTFLDLLPNGILQDGINEIENHLMILFANQIENYSEDFVDWSWNLNTSDDLYNAVSNLSYFIYSLSLQTKNRIKYESIVNYASYMANRMIVKAWNCEIRERWNRYTHDEDSLRELIEVGDRCIEILSAFDKHKDGNVAVAYEMIITIEKALCEANYPYKYWIGDYYATKYIGLTTEAKTSRNKITSEMQNKLNNINKQWGSIKERIKKEEEIRLNKEKEERIKAYWENNPELKEKLLKEKEECKIEIERLEKEKDMINADRELSEKKEEISLINQTISNLGLFALKEKKEKREQIKALEQDIEKLKAKVKTDKDSVQRKIDLQNNKIKEIDKEFSKDRT